jgi:hypothetical protein
MPLILKRNDRSEASDRFLVYSGKAHADARPER